MRSFANLFQHSLSAGRAIGATLSSYVSMRHNTLPRNNARRRFGAILIEHLEPRHLMAAVPVARDDAAFYTNVGTDLVVTTSSSQVALLANDFDIDGGTLTPSVVSNPTSGSLISFGSNGTFTYRPNSSFVGVDSFSYKVNDGTSDSNVATVRIAVGTKLLARQNLDSLNVNQPEGGLLSSGNLQLEEQLTPDQTLVYRSDSLAKPIIAVETHLHLGSLCPIRSLPS